MGTLAAALSWAARGFPVFPLRENEKEPAISDWVNKASTDADAIRAMWMDPFLNIDRNYNIGSVCNDIVVVDIDVKSGKDGYNEYLQMQGHFDTLVVQTPSGGYHCYFHGPESGNASLSSSIDVRSRNGFVVAPGSSINGKPYQVINDRDLAWVPPTIERSLSAPVTRNKDAAFDVVLDSPAMLDAGKKFLETAPVAIEGQRGDEVTFVTAARLVREMALSPYSAFELLRDHWNDRCQPPWDLDELLLKVENAARYGTAELGRLSEEVIYANVIVERPPSVFDQLNATWGNAVTPGYIRPRPWIIDRMLMEGAVTLLMAAGSAGKSSISLAIAAHLAVGKDFGPYKTRRPCKTIVYNAEDDLEEQSRRLTAVCMAYGLDYTTVSDNLMLLSRQQIKFDLVTVENRRPVRNDTIVNQLITQCQSNDVGMLIIDPLVKVHKCDESDNVQMDYVMECLSEIAQKSKIGIMLLHHTAKGGGRQEDRTGNMDISRGASAIVNASRIGFTLLNASEKDCEDYGFQDTERHMYVRLDDAKMNLTLANDNAVWFKRDGQKIPSGDVVGVLTYSEMQKSSMHMRIRVAKLIRDSLTLMGAGKMTLLEAVRTVKSEEPLWANKTDADIRRRLEDFFGHGFQVDGTTIQVVREEGEKGKSDRLFVTMK